MADERYEMAWAREQEGLDWRRRGKTRREKEGLSSDGGMDAMRCARIQDLDKSHRPGVRIGSKVRRTTAKGGG